MNTYTTLKRLIDIVGSITAIILFFPLLLAGAIWVKSVSPKGPIFADIPDRVGKDKKPFKLFKFRSMVLNGYEFLKENYPELHQKYMENNYKLEAEEDPRLLKGAKFIRKYSIDEMPQFFNVLKGEMSLVGPRPYYFFEIEEQLERFPAAKENMEKALSVKPGITGMWQVGGRSEIGFVERVALDAAYAEKKSIFFDLLLILKTPLAVLKGKGAY